MTRAPTPLALETTSRCPCGSGESYGACCELLHSGSAAARTAERLMRSRYSAFAVGDAAYLLRSWHPRTRPASLELDEAQHWLWLEIVRTERGGELDETGTVAFLAKYRLDAPDGPHSGVQSEVSSFGRVGGVWHYVDAV